MHDIKAEDMSIDPDEIEQVMADWTKQKRRSRRASRLIGVPFSFVHDVRLLTRGSNALTVALLIYRRTRICNERTVTLPTAELTELNIGRDDKRKALIKLQHAGLIQVKNLAGRTSQITLLWREEMTLNAPRGSGLRDTGE
jgi:hypothetical protein